MSGPAYADVEGRGVCCLCSQPVHYDRPFVVDGAGRDAHLSCYEKRQGFPFVPVLVTPPAGPLDFHDFDDL